MLVLIAALSIEVLAPAFHYHQFGEATRMARDAGFSALFAGFLPFAGVAFNLLRDECECHIGAVRELRLSAVRSKAEQCLEKLSGFVFRVRQSPEFKILKK